jgi:hypothetical protein
MFGGILSLWTIRKGQMPISTASRRFEIYTYFDAYGDVFKPITYNRRTDKIK